MQAIVVGGGIMGLCTAWGLVRSGHAVTVLEAADVPNPMGSSGDQHRLIRHPYGNEGGYARLIDPAFAAWDALWSDLGVRLYHPTGTLVLASGDLTWAEASLADMAALGIEVRHLSRSELAETMPMLIPDGLDLAWRVDSGGALLAEQIVAAGPWAPHLVPDLAPRVTPSRQVVIYLDPPRDLADAWARAPMVLDIHGGGGIYVVPPVANTGLKVGDHSFSLSGHPDTDRTPGDAEIEALFDACRSRFRDMDRYRTERGKTCFYTVEPQEHFIVEPMGRAVVMTGFSGHGFKFGPLMGLLTARAAAGFVPFDDLANLAAGRVRDLQRVQAITSPCLS